MSPRPLLVGESNPYSSRPDDALLPYPAGSAGARLCAMLGAGEDLYLEAFDRANLLDLSPGERWSAPRARAAAAALAGTPRHRDHVEFVLLGSRVAAAFGFAGAGPWVISPRPPLLFYLLPHPSGRSRAWNDPAAARKLRELLREFVYRAERLRGAR